MRGVQQTCKIIYRQSERNGNRSEERWKKSRAIHAIFVAWENPGRCIQSRKDQKKSCIVRSGLCAEDGTYVCTLAVLLLPCDRHVIEIRLGICFRPQADLSGIHEGVVSPVQIFRPVEITDDMVNQGFGGKTDCEPRHGVRDPSMHAKNAKHYYQKMDFETMGSGTQYPFVV